MKTADSSLSPYRAGLVFSFVNALTWLIALRTPMVLLLETLGASPFQVGLAFAWIFVLRPLQVVSTATLPALGYKRQVMLGWGARTCFLLVPLAFAVAAPLAPQPWMVWAVIASVFFFCLCRTFGTVGIFPWLYEWVPERIQGRYFAVDQSVTAACGVLTLIMTAGLFRFLPEYSAFAVSYAIALVGSVLALVALAQWPSVRKPPEKGLAEIFRRAPRLCVDAGPFRHYLLLTLVWWVMMSGVGPFTAYYLKSEAGLSSDLVLFYSSCQFLGSIISATLIGRWLDRVGVRPFFQISLLMLVPLAGFWALLAKGVHELLPWTPLAYLWLGMSGPLWLASHNKYMPRVCHKAERALAVSVHSSVVGIMAGVSPILWGFFMKTPDGSMSSDHFAIYFMALLVSMAGLAVAFARLPSERPSTPCP